MSFKITVSRILKQELTSLTYPTGQVGPLVQTIRWVKPRFRPIAKSKQFYVRQPTPKDSEEDTHMKSLYNQYATKIRATRTFISKELKNKPKVVMQCHQEDFKQLLLKNDKWNAEVAKERAIDTARLSELEAEQMRLKKESYEQFKLEKMIEAEKKFFAELEKPFISLDDLDKHIEQALDSKVNYNFAIDKKGNIIQEKEQILLEDNDTDETKS